MLRGGSPDAALDLGLAFARVGSPEANDVGDPNAPFLPQFQNYTGSGHGLRFWVYEDERLVHELLQSGFDDNLVVD